MQKKIAHKLIQECTETNNELKLAKTTPAENKNKHKCSSYTLYIALFSIIFTINVRIGTYFVNYKYMNHNKEADDKEKVYFLGNNYQA